MTSGERSLQGALLAMRQVLGDRYVLSDAGTVAKYVRTALPRGTVPVVVVRPGTTQQVRQIVRLANEHAVEWHPISRGKNWGYGAGCARATGR